MEPQRIILTQIPRFLKEMLERALTDIPGVSIVGEITDWARLPAAIKQTEAQWVIVSLPSGEPMPEAADALLARHPAIRMLNMATDGGHVTLKWLEPHEQSIDELSMEELITLFRSADPMNGNASMNASIATGGAK